MLATFSFLAFWVLLGLGLLYVALRGGIGGVRQTLQAQSRGPSKAVGMVFTALYIAFGIALPAALLTGNHANASAQVGGVKLTAADKRGRELFGEHCTVCHTLAAANAAGKVGPNLDTLRPAASLVLHTLKYGCLPNPPSTDPEVCLGQGVMPAALVQGKDATAVAAFVAKVAGNE
ncbi:MAG: hypothetical protein ACR2LV_00040 [Solirubrobacteraceae bacterium]